MAMEEAHRLGAHSIEIRSDSELMVKQMNGDYRVKTPHLKPLHRKACELARLFKKVNIVHVRREENEKADELANIAIGSARAH